MTHFGNFDANVINILECFQSSSLENHCYSQNILKCWSRFSTFYIILSRINFKIIIISEFSTWLPSFWWLNYSFRLNIKRDIGLWNDPSFGKNHGILSTLTQNGPRSWNIPVQKFSSILIFSNSYQFLVTLSHLE